MLASLSLSWWKLWAQIIIWMCERLHREGLTHICKVIVNAISTCRLAFAAFLSFNKNNEQHSEAHFSVSLFPLPDLPFPMCTLRGQKIMSYHKSSILFALNHPSYPWWEHRTQRTPGSADSADTNCCKPVSASLSPFQLFKLVLHLSKFTQRTAGSPVQAHLGARCLPHAEAELRVPNLWHRKPRALCWKGTRCVADTKDHKDLLTQSAELKAWLSTAPTQSL